MITVAIIALYLIIGAVWAWSLDAERHRYAESVTGLDPELARFECRYGWVRDLFLWPVHAIGGLCVIIARALRFIRGGR